MRLFLLALALIAGTADAKDCEPPKRDGKEIKGLISFSECMIDKVAALERENAELRKTMAKIEASLKKFPGALVNENGRVSRTGGDSLVQATFVTEARRREGPVALAIDQTALETLCSTGCTLTLTLEAEGLRKDDPGSVSAVAACAFRYTATSGAWSQGGGCGDAVAGVDGDGKPPGKSGGDIIATVGEACLLADSPPSRSVDAQAQLLDGDRERGLNLIAVPARFTGTEARFRCTLRIAQ